MSSNGHKEHRYIVSTSIEMGGVNWEIEVSLSNRDPLKYRLLLGREALNNRVLIHPGIACNQGKISKLKLSEAYSLIALDKENG